MRDDPAAAPDAQMARMPASVKSPVLPVLPVHVLGQFQEPQADHAGQPPAACVVEAILVWSAPAVDALPGLDPHQLAAQPVNQLRKPPVQRIGGGGGGVSPKFPLARGRAVCPSSPGVPAWGGSPGGGSAPARLLWMAARGAG